jgi:hypothetical protein
MTPEERAESINEDVGCVGYHVRGQIIADAIRAAVAEEREACAAIVERLDGEGELTGSNLRRAIHARSQA